MSQLGCLCNAWQGTSVMLMPKTLRMTFLSVRYAASLKLNGITFGDDLRDLNSPRSQQLTNDTCNKVGQTGKHNVG